MKVLLNFILIIMLLFSCNIQQTPKVTSNNFTWLKGSWTQEMGNTKLIETWDYSSKNLLSGSSFYIKNLDTIYTEILKIEIQQDGVYYSAAVSNQNNGKSVKFGLISKITADTLIFENKYHDFPQRINYIKAKNDTLKTFIDGYNKGVYKKTDFLFTK